MSSYEDRRRDVSREDRMGDREAAEIRDRRHDQVRHADMGQTPRNIAEYEDRVRGGYPRVSGDERAGHSERGYSGGYSATSGEDRGGRDHGRADYAMGMRDDMRRYGGDDRSERPYADRSGGGSYQEDRSGDRGFGYRSFSGSLGGGMGQQYGYGQGGRGYTDDNNPRSYRSGRPAQGGEDRGFLSRAGDEIATWFGSDEAEGRRERDARQGDEGAQHHVGRGPKNYKRSDSRIEEDINDRLTRDPRIDASDIEVSVKDGEVTLTGHVDTRQDKRRAEDLADDVSGVNHVQNNLRIRGREGVGTGAGASRAGEDYRTNRTGETASTSIGTTGSSGSTGATVGGSFGNSRND